MDPILLHEGRKYYGEEATEDTEENTKDAQEDTMDTKNITKDIDDNT